MTMPAASFLQSLSHHFSVIAALFPKNFLPQCYISAVPPTLLFLFFSHPCRRHHHRPCCLFWHCHCTSLLFHCHCTALIVLFLFPQPPWSSPIIIPRLCRQLPSPSFYISADRRSTSSTAVFDFPASPMPSSSYTLPFVRPEHLIYSLRKSGDSAFVDACHSPFYRKSLARADLLSPL